MSIPTVFAALVDDAAIFPPGSLPLPEAVPAHAAHRGSPLRALVGPFVVGAGDLAAAAESATPALFPDALPVSVVVPGPEAVGATVDLAGRLRVTLAALEVKLDPARPLAEQVARIAARDRRGAITYVEAPRPGHAEWPQVLTAVAGSGLRLKFRTGGTEARAFPSEAEVAEWIAAAARTATPFKCTAGLHNAIRHTDAVTGFEHHGFLNILCAAAAAVEGATAGSLAAILAERDAHALTGALADRARTAAARTLFASYGSCSVQEPYDDLAALGLLGP
ncbi:hypothetical protein BJY24_005114 [Nocardia transvalensis]|uniref:Uncharacterized protein n=1 Tax=Nocardia transvalensis TaxID=37333 RepID=A0A7W9UKD2_9NOCA|nr:hypothetical protein [Nocardia transvalensis]MBB5916202.1 hypothetical protein [Nocardia transvalensis]